RSSSPSLLEVLRLALVLQPFHDLLDVLRSVGRGYEQGVGGVHNDQTVEADGGDQLAGRAVDYRAAGVQGDALVGQDHVGPLLLGQLVVEDIPRTHVGPAQVRRDDEHLAALNV